MQHTFTLLTALLMFALTGCDAPPETSDKDVEPISYTRLREMMAEASEDNPVLLIDVRTLAKFEEGHIPGAINIFLPDLKQLKKGDPRVADADKIVVYAGGFGDSLSPIAAKDLLSRGFVNVYDFRGGWQKWQKEQAGGAADAPKPGDAK